MKKLLLLIPILFLSYDILYSQDDPKLTETWDPIPKIVIPGLADEAASDAVVLFNYSVSTCSTLF